MNNETCLPAMGTHAQLASGVEQHETLLASILLDRAHGGTRLRGLLLSETASGEYRLRLCEGADDAWMIWIDQRRARSQFGRAYAEALASSWLDRMEADGWRVIWQARREDRATRLPVAA
ncbi:hypothetical protein [Sinimarinibacterium thermocellulolyticum]|uniref:Uncharacterized protein n=1 Tax=Sinimarinibacterium thermocellulolyticum TaxID=3170016 RepID=A0ABV2ADB0_9GAMM